MIEVKYDGEFPNTCRGTLTIIEDDKVIYKDKYSCHSTGHAWVDSDNHDHVTSGELEWAEEEAAKFSQEIRDAVAEKLSEFHVCCGGCI